VADRRASRGIEAVYQPLFPAETDRDMQSPETILYDSFGSAVVYFDGRQPRSPVTDPVVGHVVST